MDRNNVEVKPKESMMMRAIRSAGDKGPEFAEAVYKGTLQAGADLKGTVEQAGRNVLAAAQEAAAEVERKVGDAISRSAKVAAEMN